jgi:hypothetical protein
MKAWPALAALLLALAGCATPPPAAKPDGGPALVPEASVLRHRASGMAFPAEVAGFLRGTPHIYDAAGLDVSAGYELATLRGRMIATMYVFPAPANTGGTPPADMLFARYKAEVGAVHGGAKPVAELRAEPPPGAARAEGWHARYAYTDDFVGTRAPLRSELFVFCCIAPGWALEYRFTHVQGSGLDEAVGQFMRALRVTIPAGT